MNETKEKFKETVDNAGRFTRSMLDDLGTSEIPSTLKRDMMESYDFFLDEDERQHLTTKGSMMRSILITWYMARSLFLKLTPVRRIILLVGVLLAIQGNSNDDLQVIAGILSLLFVLGLELKDKITAKDELNEGRAVQLAIMPADTPELEGWEIWMHSRPANEVGGDLIDHLTTSQNRLALSLGDVAGKGLPAALMAAKMQATLRAIATEYDDLAPRTDRLNQIAMRDGLPSRFASLIHVELNSESGEVTFVNAGHHPPIRINQDGFEEFKQSGPAIGLTRSASFEKASVSLSDDDLFILYSDGVPEARNEIGRFYSDERFFDLVKYTHGMSARSVGERIVQSVDEFVRTARQSDDLSIIIIRRLPV